MPRSIIIYTVYLSIFINNTVCSQITTILWEHNFGGSDFDRPFEIKSTIDSGFIIAGETKSSDIDVTLNKGSYDFWLVKIDSLGNLEWEKTYGGTSFDYCYDFTTTTDGGYLLVGASYSSDGDITDPKGNSDFWIVKVDDIGNLEWQKSFGGSSSEAAHTVIQNSKGDFVISGSCYSTDGDVTGHHGSNDQSDIWIINISEGGELKWQKSYGSFENDYVSGILESDSGEYILSCSAGEGTGEVSEFNGGSSDYWIIKLDTLGNLLWENTFGGNGNDQSTGICIANESAFIVTGLTSSNSDDVVGNHGSNDVWDIMIDSVGNKIWAKCYGGTESESGRSIIKKSENEFLIINNSNSIDFDLTENYGSADYWVVSIDSMGNIIWQKSIGGSELDDAFAIIESEDNNYCIAGASKSSDFDVSTNYGNFDFWIVKIGVCSNNFFQDLDGDGFGNILIDSVACEQPIGYVVDNSDCNDNNSDISPDVIEWCNNIDDNCNGNIDDGLVFIFTFIDFDNDGYGNATVDSFACNIPDGYVLDSTDCDDANSDIYPGAPEVLNGLDDDCDNLTDEGLDIQNTILSSVSVYPNPTDKLLNIEYSGNGVLSIGVWSITGEVLSSKELISTELTIDVGFLPSGLYLLRITTDFREAVIPFVKQ